VLREKKEGGTGKLTEESKEKNPTVLVEEERAYIDLLLDPMRLALIEVISATKS
jgi:3-dehydroquinate dehydratase